MPGKGTFCASNVLKKHPHQPLDPARGTYAAPLDPPAPVFQLSRVGSYVPACPSLMCCVVHKDSIDCETTGLFRGGMETIVRPLGFLFMGGGD